MISTPTGSSASNGPPLQGRSAARLRLQYRIVLPLLAAALVATSAATWVGVGVTSRALRSRLEAQLVNAADAISSSEFSLNPNILVNVKRLAGADVVTVGPDGEVLARSFADERPLLLAAVRRGLDDERAEPGAIEADCGFPCLMTIRPVVSRPGTRVALVADASPLAAATQAVVRTMFLAAAASVVLLVLVSQAVVRRVTAPLERLVTFVRASGADPGARRAEVGDNEIGALAAAFNGMLDRLEQSRAALVRSEKLGLAGLFAARVAHDIRNPLSSIRMQTQLLQSKAAAVSDDQAVLSDMLRDVDQVESVVRDLMDLANPGELRLRTVPLNEVVESALDQMAHQLAHRKVVVDRRLANGLPALQLDAGRFKQALLNLLVNASEAMHTGGTMVVSTGRSGDRTLFVRICDDGVGVDPSLLDRVFDPFVSTKPEGVGLGLANVRAVVTGHGGRIKLEPRKPRGTCAAIDLPEPAGG
jgi:signal transduction histidine kinase